MVDFDPKQNYTKDEKCMIGYVHPVDYDSVVRKLREFFHKKGFLEVHTQSRLSILAACEDPGTISNFGYAGQLFPLPQTGQMWLEYELLTKPDIPGFFNIGTSFRNEPTPVPGRHDLIFPMFEFEMHGDMEALMLLERELCEFLGYGSGVEYKEVEYDDMAKKYNVSELEHEHEEYLNRDYGDVVLLKNFPNSTSPFWNMKNNGTHAKKVDIIIDGVETIGSAERSCDKEEMRRMFDTITDGNYARTLYGGFTKERVEKEMQKFLEHDFVPRSGGGIGLTRLIKSMKKHNLI